MAELLHTWALVAGLNREVVWLTIFTGIVCAGLTASYINLSIWKGMVIAMAAVGAALLAMPWMHPLWSHFAAQGGVAGLGSGESDHLAWIGMGAVAALGGAVVGGRVSATAVEAVWVTLVSGVAMWTTHTALTHV